MALASYILAAWSIVTGMLIFRRAPKSRVNVRLFILASLVHLVTVAGVVVSMEIDQGVPIHVPSELIGQLSLGVLWLVYVFRNGRVRATLP